MYNFNKTETDNHNNRLEAYAKEKSLWLKEHPTDLEKQMKEFLESHNIKYNFKKPLFYAPRGQYMKRFVIADFFIPSEQIIIDIGYTSFSKEDKYSSVKFEELCKKCLYLTVLHWSASDFKSYQNMKTLLALLGKRR